MTVLENQYTIQSIIIYYYDSRSAGQYQTVVRKPNSNISEGLIFVLKQEFKFCISLDGYFINNRR